VARSYSPDDDHTRIPPAANSTSRSPSMIFRENRVKSNTITPSHCPDSNRRINASHCLRTTLGFHADNELSLNTSPTRAPRSANSSRHTST